MIKSLVKALLFSFALFSNAQQKATIDSLNKLPFATKIENAANLDDDFLKNAEDAHKLKYILGEAESYSNLSLVYYFQGKYEKDLQYALKAIELFSKINAQEKIALEYGEVGYRMKTRNIKKAQQFMRKGKSIAEQNRFQKPLLSIYNNYGVLKEMQQEYDSALYFYSKGLRMKEQINDSVGIPYSLNNIAGLYVILKKYEEAKVLYDKAIAIRIQRHDQSGIAENYAYYGDLYAAQNQNEKAILWYEKALKNAIKFRYTDLIQFCYNKIAENYEVLNNTSEALKNYKLYLQYRDSLLNKETNAKISELEVKYETKEKEKLLLQKEVESQKQKYLIIALAVFAFFISLVGYLIYRQQKLKNRQQVQEFQLKSAIVQIENQNQLQEQRLSISRDLHDNIGAQLTFIISSVDNIRYAFDIQNEKLDHKLQNISNFAKATIIELRDTIWAMNSNEITFEDLQIRVLNFLEKAKAAKEEIDFKFTIDKNLYDLKLNAVFGMNVYRVMQEAINNALKYANPNQIAIDVTKIDGKVSVKIIDNGVGFDLKTIEKGNGLNNMQKRIEGIGGFFSMQSEVGRGTTISILLSI